MTLAGRRVLWLAAALLLLAAAGGGRQPMGNFTAAAEGSRLELRHDLNSAGMAELESLPGIGPSLAGRILKHRNRHGPFRSIEGLGAVPGIGEKTVRSLRPYLALCRGGAFSESGE